MAKRIRLGMLTPSSNTVLEPVTMALLADLPEVSAHFSRFSVTEIALSDRALGQFNLEPLLAAAQLLADAKVDVIAWNGTSAGWLGLETDRELCRQITAKTGIPATTSVLALTEQFWARGFTRFGLVTPYLPAVQERILQNYAQEGFDCVAEHHLSLQDNFSFAEVSPDQLRAMVRQVTVANPQVITTFCTNLAAAPLVAELEQELGIPIFDTIAVVVWQSLRIAGVDPTRIQGWGRLFSEVG
ncbi:aspartate/glutamate racemase family protein [Leptolyngbya sp. BL0902]|uniref:maleate cis-trans isomerase family protein n=1 Tax=Leptolyngbya sp. BL0902 TaxID=1115757 RepID=UPI0018E76685|nr:aspartate/glutamate racemase family protein [Leptolyngbya sp. BL0902]